MPLSGKRNNFRISGGAVSERFECIDCWLVTFEPIWRLRCGLSSLGWALERPDPLYIYPSRLVLIEARIMRVNPRGLDDLLQASLSGNIL